MLQPIVVEVRYTVEDAVRAARFIQNRSFLYRHDALVTAGLVFIAFLLLIVLMANELTVWVFVAGSIWSVIPAVLVGLTVWLMHGPIGAVLARRRVKKYFSKSPLIREPVRIEFSDEQIATSTSLSSTVLKWDAIISILISPTDFIFYTGNEKFGWAVPKRAFSTPMDLEIFEDHLKVRFADRINY